MNAINSLLRAFIGALIATLVISVATGVFYRYVLNYSLHWAAEVPNVLLIWIVFIGSAVAFHEKKHIAFTVVADSLPRLPQRLVGVLAQLVVIAFLVVLVVWGYEIVERAMSSRSDALKVPRGYFYICVPAAGVLMLIDSFISLFNYVFRPERMDMS